MPKVLECYPFTDPRIRLVEGFAFYDGILGDIPGDRHKGIDYILPLGEGLNFDHGVCLNPDIQINSNGLRAVSFDVCAMHTGQAYQGKSDSWGKFVAITTTTPRAIFRSIYAHLARVNPTIPLFDPNHAEKNGSSRPMVQAGDVVGRAGTTGRTNRIIQLHIELMERKGEGASWEKIDPYGIFVRSAKSGAYPQPNTTLAGLKFHRWISDNPPLAAPRR